MESAPSRRPPGLVIALWLASSWLGCVLVVGPELEPATRAREPFARTQSECLPRFPDGNGWHGGDAAYSVPLPIDEGRVSLWLFGDSFVDRPEHIGKRSYPFIHNSIGLSLCEAGGRWRLDTFWQHDETGEPRAFFIPDDQAEWVRRATEETGRAPYYWPFDGFVANDALFVGLLRVVPSAPRGRFNLPFRLIGMDLARIENFRDPPSAWQIRISTLSRNREAFPGSSFVARRTHIEAFAFFDRADGRAPRMLARIPLQPLDRWRPDLSKELEYLARDSHWKKGFRPGDALILMDDAASEMSVHFDLRTKEWIAVYSRLAGPDPSPESAHEAFKAAPDPSGYIWFRRARALSGPWSPPEKLFAIPEMHPTPPERVDENLFCYAGKAHPQFSSQRRLVLTYVCNLFARQPAETESVLQRLSENPTLYRVRAVTVPFPPSQE